MPFTPFHPLLMEPVDGVVGLAVAGYGLRTDLSV